MATDIVLDQMIDGQLQITADFLNKNVRDALSLLLSPDTAILIKDDTQTYAAWPTWTAVIWTVVVADSDGAVTPQWSGTNPTRIICQTPGWYEVDINIPMAMDNGSNALTTACRINGDNNRIYAGDSVPCTDSGSQFGCNFATLIKLPNVGDYIEVLVRITRSVSQPSIVYWNSPRIVFRRVRGI
jgi:hypothetical protein